MGRLSPKVSNNPTVDADIVTTEQLAQWLKCTPKWIIRARGTGGGPPFLVLADWSIRYSKKQVLSWLEQHRQFTDTSQSKRVLGKPGRGRPRQA
jgi:hypothetical protein